MMVSKLNSMPFFEVKSQGDETREIKSVYCCDLLSLVMGKAPSDCAWVTVMANINALAVASLADISCIIFAEGVAIDISVLEKAKEKNINIFSAKTDIFNTAKLIDSLIKKI
ncbi:MAG: DRTGG domain-containing protein [Oscillospiraceae bacterium]